MDIPMDAHKRIREHISALSDGELATSDLELASAALRAPDGELAWIAYHRIGDVLRGQQAPEFSAGFDARLAARLAAEPPPVRRAVSMPVAAADSPEPVPSAKRASKAITTP
jgi:sigma-E factor negative regulatory protein RseA